MDGFAFACYAKDSLLQFWVFSRMGRGKELKTRGNVIHVLPNLFGKIVSTKESVPEKYKGERDPILVGPDIGLACTIMLVVMIFGVDQRLHFSSRGIEL